MKENANIDDEERASLNINNLDKGASGLREDVFYMKSSMETIGKSINEMISFESSYINESMNMVLGSLQSLTSAVTKMYSTIDFSELASSFQQFARNISSIFEQIRIPSISEERKKELVSSYERWGKFGWTLNPIEGSDVVRDICPLDKRNADKLALSRFSVSRMDEIFSSIQTSPRVKKNDFKEAMADYQNKSYKSCALLIFSLIDAQLIRLQNKKGLKTAGRRKVGFGAVQEARNRTEREINTALFVTGLFLTNVFACLETVFENGNDFIQQPVIINRNFLGHGMLIRRVTRKDCIQLFLLYYNMLQLLGMIY